MLKKEQQQRHFEAAWQSMLDHLTGFCATQKNEELHRLRVAVKKIRALLFFLQKHAHPGLPERAAVLRLKAVGPLDQAHSGLPEPLHVVFKQAGRIRAAGLHVQMLEQYRISDPALIAGQQKIMADETARLCAACDSHVETLGQLGRALSGQFRDVEEKTILRRVKKQGKKLAGREYDVHSLHKIRKQIKRLLYLHGALPKTLARKIRWKTTARLDRLQHAIGEWHDVDDLIKLLKTAGSADQAAVARLRRRRERLYAAVLALSDV